MRAVALLRSLPGVLLGSLLGALLCLAGAPAAASGTLDEAALRVAFVYRFAQFTQWPPPPLREFTYCVAGIKGAAEDWRQLGGRPMEVGAVQVQMLESPAQASQCQLLVLGFSDRAELRRWLQAIGDDPVLVVGQSPEAYRAGASIVLSLEPNGMSFKVNNTEARRRGLQLSSQMLRLAREVR